MSILCLSVVVVEALDGFDDILEKWIVLKYLPTVVDGIMKRPAEYIIHDVAQLRAIATAARHEIVAIMEELEEFSVGDLAAYLGRPAESIYYHVNNLVSVGLVLEVSTRVGNTRPEKLYALVGRRLFVDRECRDPEYRAILKKSARSVVRLSERLLHRALDDPRCHLSGPHANFQLHQRSARLSKPKLRQLAKLLAEVDQFLLDNNDPNQGVSYVVTSSFAPVLAWE